ncbi:hypothetical protein BGW36DRAFT_366253 [Talaromyces proteolyticus]|uniref:Uncharacterized protein n=1 Tax=Talaromyces proteolyticus TaxID=1131652 RepID=A0AAD4L1F0_9EURO|nr:uncharacterized protein BGW36DRAFT_366253 [Talaromyces proteolyticus]KAH8704835.1 hypothetical protein BGW36DRAFT_366253 [Talaromyces proteolyticus]
MAFRLPTQAPPRRQASYSTPERPSLKIQPPEQSHADVVDDDAKEWVLFSPSQAASTARTRSDSTERTARTAGLSRLSDFGSFNAVTTNQGTDDNASSEDVLDDEEEEEEEDATELDSLDEGLRDFRESNLPDKSNPVLPTHDGLGSFHASGQLAQDRLWQFEQYNPHRQADATHTRRSSVQKHLETVDEQESKADRERWQRIEKWRTEQSRILLQEIERETKRRQRRNSRGTSSHMTETLDSISETNQADLSTSSSTDTSVQGDSPEESFWKRITRKVIRDLIGINDSILSVILGESLVEDADLTQFAESKGQANAHGIEDAIRDVPITSSSDDNMWQEKLIQRIARELGILVNQIWEHPGAFSTYLRVENPSDFYAGIPVKPSESTSQSTRSLQTQPDESNILSTTSPHFTPTLKDPVTAEHAAQWGIEDDEIGANHSRGPHEPLSDSAYLNQEYAYWERDLDIAMVFRYLKNRFRKTDTGNNTTTRSMHREQQDASSRAAVIRQHHPLVARAHARSQARQSSLRTQFHAAGIPTPASPISRHRFRRPSSSCASQSTRVSAKRLGSGSSRHYWDIGGSVGSGSAAVSVGGPTGVGTWGEA